MNKLTPTELMDVEVPIDARDFKEREGGTFVYLHGKGGMNMCSFIYLPFGEYEILGTVSKGSISFNVEPYVELLSITRTGWFGYKNYLISTKGKDDFTCKTATESFYSLLESNERYFVNPMGKPILNHYPFSDEGVKDYRSDLAEWQSYENKLIKGKLLILKPKN